MGRLEREDVARRYLDSAEAWLRRIVHHQLSSHYGPGYFNTEGVIKKNIRDYAQSQIDANPGRFARHVDTTSFEQICEIITGALYEGHFKVPLSLAYLLGRAEAKYFLRHLREIRNDVSHVRGCSARQLERAICYSNDLIDSLTEYFRSTGMEREYDVPRIIRTVDNLGNESHLENVSENINMRNVDWRKAGRGDLRPGDTLVAEVEIDPSFENVGYEVTWYVFGGETGSGPLARIAIQVNHVAEQFELVFRVRSQRDWHRFGQYDDGLALFYRVLPPVAR